MTKQVERSKWILYRHTRDFYLLCEVAKILKSYSKTGISKKEKEKLNLRLRDLGLYSERNSDLPLDAISHKINQLSYYMFGYQVKDKSGARFMFSPLGNLLLNNLDDKIKVSKIFLTMLWAVQYEHPHGGTDSDFNLYPFRLIFKLLSDEKLDCKLYAYEVAYLVVFEKIANSRTYNSLVKAILKLRKCNDKELASKFKEDRHAYVNSAYEWDYYVSNFFVSAGVLEKTDGDIICKLQHGNTSTYRKITRNVVRIPEYLKEYVMILEGNYPFSSSTLSLNDAERLKIDVTKEIYSFYPEVLSAEIGVENDFGKLLELPKLIERYSNNPENETAYMFEEVLEEGFNMFYNVEAKRIGGAGQTDIECLYLTENKKFAVESKSTANKLVGINVGRLREQREKIGGKYTIVVTPRYVPAAKRDIKGSQVVILLASTFAEYLYNCINSNIRTIDYKEFDDIVVANLGTDISQKISDMSISKFSISAR